MPPASPAPAAESTVSRTFLATDFEHGLTGWTVVKNGGSATCAWQLETQRARSPTHGEQCGDGTTYAPNSDTDLVSPTIDLSSAKSASLSFYEYADGEAFFFWVFDYGTVSVSGDNGATWAQLETDIWSVSQWTNDTLDLSQASGIIGSSQVKLKFNWVSDSSAENAGWFVDDLKVWGSANGASAPGAPTGLVATGGNAQVSLSWTAPSDGGSPITDYRIYRATTSGGESYLAHTAGTNASFVDHNVANGVTYYYEVSAVNSVGEGAKSTEASATPSGGATVPGAPTGLAATGGNAQVSLSWTAPSDGGSPITDYKIYRGTSSGGEGLYSHTGAANTSYTDGNAVNGVTYYYKASAVNTIGEGAKSNEASATPSGGGGGGNETEVTCHVFATREGLVGGTTANGHTIVSHDHFVALPSPRALGSDGGHEFMVTVKNPANGDTATEPVWDTGPWNTKDDYWAPANVRQSWTDLAQCKPEAQAAYQDGYNGGKDQFGRTVTNPAGIDLADGTFWDSLGMTDNGWVDVTFRWTNPTVTVYKATSSGALNVRTGPSTSYTIEGTTPSGSLVASFDTSGGWPSFSYATKPGWSSSSYLSAVTGGSYAEIKIEGSTLRSGPGGSYSQLGTVNWPEKFVLTSNAQNPGCGSAGTPWCEVWWDGQKGWVDAYTDATMHGY